MSDRGPNGVHFGYFESNPVTPIRARAYNDSVKDAVLLKTASNRGSTGPLDHPKMVTILGPQNDTGYVTIQVVLGYPCIRTSCECVP